MSCAGQCRTFKPSRIETFIASSIIGCGMPRKRSTSGRRAGHICAAVADAFVQASSDGRFVCHPPRLAFGSGLQYAHRLRLLSDGFSPNLDNPQSCRSSFSPTMAVNMSPTNGKTRFASRISEISKSRS